MIGALSVEASSPMMESNIIDVDTLSVQKTTTAEDDDVILIDMGESISNFAAEPTDLTGSSTDKHDSNESVDDVNFASVLDLENEVDNASDEYQVLMSSDNTLIPSALEQRLRSNRTALALHNDDLEPHSTVALVEELAQVRSVLQDLHDSSAWSVQQVVLSIVNIKRLFSRLCNVSHPCIRIFQGVAQEPRRSKKGGPSACDGSAVRPLAERRWCTTAASQTTAGSRNTASVGTAVISGEYCTFKLSVTFIPLPGTYTLFTIITDCIRSWTWRCTLQNLRRTAMCISSRARSVPLCTGTLTSAPLHIG